MKPYINGVNFDYENGSLMTLTASLEGESAPKLIPYQVRMIMENHIPRLLPLSVEEASGLKILRYDISDKRRFLQLMLTASPSFEMWAEAAYHLVKSVSECSEYMLSEQGFVLHEDLIFAGKNLLDIQFCYLPVEGGIGKPVTEELRRLLLRTLAMVNGPIGAEIKPILGLLSQEPYALQQLKNQLMQLRLREKQEEEVPDRKQIANSGRKHNSWSLSRAWMRIRKKIGEPDGKDKTAIPSQAGKTEVLVKRDIEKDVPVVFHIQNNGHTEDRVMNEQRFIIGRSSEGVHYTDLTGGVSRIHCEIIKSEEGLVVKDLGSLNGTCLNDQNLIPYKSYPFKDGDVLKVARTELRMADGRQSSRLVESDNRASY